MMNGPPQGVRAGPGTITTIAGLTFAISDERGARCCPTSVTARKPTTWWLRRGSCAS